MNCPYFNNFHNLQNYLFTPLGKNENKREKYDYTIQIILLTHMDQTFYDNIAAEVIRFDDYNVFILYFFSLSSKLLYIFNKTDLSDLMIKL